jgi:hypothetical protein
MPPVTAATTRRASGITVGFPPWSRSGLRLRLTAEAPRETRRKLITALNNLDHKRDKNPPKKHGNIPL